MIRIESSVLVRDSGTLLSPDLAQLTPARTPGRADLPQRMKHLLIYSSEGCFTLQIERFSRYKINGVACKLKELESMKVESKVRENRESARAMTLNEQITNAKKNTEVE